MRLLHIADYPGRWTVLAIENEKGESPWRWLEGAGDNKRSRGLATKMRARIREHIPRYGPPEHPFHGTRLKGTDGIAELRVGPKKGPKLRVLYFFGRKQREIILTDAFWKATDTAPEDIARAEKARRAYFQSPRFEVRRLEPHKKGSDR
jgi:phage-related protein